MLLNTANEHYLLAGHTCMSKAGTSYVHCENLIVQRPTILDDSIRTWSIKLFILRGGANTTVGLAPPKILTHDNLQGMELAQWSRSQSAGWG